MGREVFTEGDEWEERCSLKEMSGREVFTEGDEWKRGVH